MQNQGDRPPGTPVDVGRQRLTGAGFERLHINLAHRAELYAAPKGRKTRTVTVSFLGNDFTQFMTESLERALAVP